MEILEANAVPLSYDPPTPDEKMKSKELEAYLRSLGLYETKDEVTHRQELLESLQNLVRESVKQILKNQNAFTNQSPEELANLFTFGSFRMGINEPSADIDSMAVGPAAVSRDLFFDIMEAYLKSDPKASDITVIPDAFVPIISMKYGGIDFDLSYAPINRYQTRLPVDFNILDDNNLRNCDDQTVRSLNGRRVTDTILNIVPDRSTFLLVLKAFRYWAQNRGLYKNVMGYFGGVNCALLCSFACMSYPKAAPAVVLRQCFRLFSEWAWPSPVALTPVVLKPELGQDEGVWNPKTNEKARSDLFPLLTPCYPSQNSCYTVMRSTRDVIVREFARGAEVTEKVLRGETGWAELFRKFPFFSAYKYYIQVEVSASSEDLFNQWYGFVESRMRRFIPFIEAREGVRTHLYPKSFAPPGREHCKAFFVALILENANTVVDLAGAVANFKALLAEQFDLQTVEIEFTSFKNTSKGNELPDYLFPEGKKVKHRKRTKTGVESEAKKVN
ncbi:hypothetical protein WA538_001865, partial [Blastocystis sp. DL]